MSNANPVAVITGASRGFGAALAHAFWAQGFNLLLTARNADALAKVAEDLQTASVADQQAKTFAYDAASPDAGRCIAQATIDTFGRIDALICNAAIQGPIGAFWENDPAAWEAALTVDLLGPVRLVHAALPHIRGRGGTILFVSGGGATGPRPHFSAYATAKAGLVRFAETLAHELKHNGVTVNCIAPGAMPTAMLQDVAAAGWQAAGEREFETAKKTLEGGAEVMMRAAELAVFLASSRARSITGKLISAMWDDWSVWPNHIDQLRDSDVYTLRRITGRDRNMPWGDK